MNYAMGPADAALLSFPPATPALEKFGLKFSRGGPHISRTMMLADLASVLAAVPAGAPAGEYHDAICERNVLGKATDSTRRESLRRLRELYALDESVPIFAVLRTLHSIDPASLPLLAVQAVWARDPLFRATTTAILSAAKGERVETVSFAQAVDQAFPGEYSEISRNSVSRHAASSWTQSGHLAGRAKKVRDIVKASPAVVTFALFMGTATGFHGAAVFSNPWCRLLDLPADQARARALEAHRAGLLDLRVLGEIVELAFPRLAKFLPEAT